MPPYLLMIVTPIALVFGTAVGARRMRLDARDDLGLRLPRARDAAIALLLFLAVATASEMLYRHWGLAEGTGDWRGKYGPAALALRIVMAALIFPITEELFFRGLLFGLIRRRSGEAVAVLGSSVAFTLLHLQYDARGMLLVFVDALFFGLVRSRTRSTLLTMGLHVLGNAFAVWQRL